MRYQGTITTWKDEKGYGFIAPRGGGDEIFVHIKGFTDRGFRPTVKDVVTYEVAHDEKRRLRAVEVEILGAVKQNAGPTRTALAWGAIAFVFIGGLFFWSMQTKTSFLLPIYYALISAITFLAYALDKLKANANEWRIAEGTLHLLDLIGGWPGALVAQHLLRHKVRKAAFIGVFWITVFLNCAALALVATPLGRALLNG